MSERVGGLAAGKLLGASEAVSDGTEAETQGGLEGGSVWFGL